MRRRLLLTVVAASVALAAVPAALALLPETPVAASARNEFKPAADFHSNGDELVSFSRSRAGHPNRYDAILRRVSGGITTRIKLNTKGQGHSGGIDSPLVAYQQVVNGRSNIFVYNIDDLSRTPPAGVNTSRWEYGPTVSGDWLLFGRDDNRGSTERIVLHRISTHADLRLARVLRARYSLVPGQVQGNWATYTRCAPVCNVIRYDIGAGTRTRLSKPVTSPPRYQFGGAVTSTGVVYLARSGPRCGSNLKIVRYFGATDAANGTVVATLPKGRDLISMFARENGDGTTDVFYDRVACNTLRWDVYKVTDGP